MRKKSHISLACYIVSNTDNIELKKHRFAFIFGSVLPDVKPSFLYRRHEINGTFHDVKNAIVSLSDEKHSKQSSFRFFRDLGQVTHYLADYFTFPHNECYTGSLKDHCDYEEHLKKDLKKYLKEGLADFHCANLLDLTSPEDIEAFILRKHEEYLEWADDVKTDIYNIVSVNLQTVKSILSTA
ncbi:MAG: zinc dependent phospholipase C family protein [Lachnospiraceae bacterium]